jgi:cbb3-type cytochrome c oxidase subunit I
MAAKSQVKSQNVTEAEVDFSEGDRVAKTWFAFAILWFPFFAAFGFLLAIKFFFPDFLSGSAWDTFGRIRPAHVNGVLFGFVSSGLLGAMFWIVPRLCARPLFRPKLAAAIPFLWNFAVLAGIILILLGNTQGREYAELPWGVDVAVVVTLIMMAYIVFGTIIRRKEKKLYVSLWYFMGTLVWFPILYIIGNVMWHPPEGALNGTIDAIYNWYYGHNVLGLWFTTLGIPIWYYFIPRILKRPLYSHLLSLIAFFTIAFFYTGVGSHHLLQAPIPEWLKTIGITMSVLMLVPVITFATNIILTMRGSWHRLIGNHPLQFMMAGFFMYIITSFQGSFQALRSTNMFLHFSQWTVGHAHLALLGGFGFLAIAMAYYLIPRITGIRLFSNRLMRLSFWVAFIGFIFFWLAMTMAGLAANSNWWQHINPVQTLPTLRPYFIWRALAGGTIVVAAIIFAYNTLMTLFRGRHPHVEETVEGLGKTTSQKPHSVFLRRSQEGISIPVLIGGGMAVFSIMTFMVIGIPSLYAPSEPTLRAQPLSAIEQQGQELYKNLGCVYCHSQQTRPQDWAMGENSEAGDFYFSVPNFLGTERTGPNLAQIGGMRPSEWQTQHHTDPRSVSPASIMPPFPFLTEDEHAALTAYLQKLGGENLDTLDFQPAVPWEYRGMTNPYDDLAGEVAASYDFKSGEYSGSSATGQEWANLFEEGKMLYTQKCLSCHGGSGNGQGPYARNTVERPANLNERISNYPQPPDDFQFWRVSGGVPGTRMPQWGMSQSEDTIWKINNYELSFVTGAMRTVPVSVPAEDAINYANSTSATPPISGTVEEYKKGQALYNLYCAQCHGVTGNGDGPASSLVPGGYINPPPISLIDAGAALTTYGEYLYFIREGYATTNMPPWKYVFNDEETYQVIFYTQCFAPAEEYNAYWAPLYTDQFAKGLKQ